MYVWADIEFVTLQKSNTNTLNVHAFAGIKRIVIQLESQQNL